MSLLLPLVFAGALLTGLFVAVTVHMLRSLRASNDAIREELARLRADVSRLADSQSNNGPGSRPHRDVP